MPARIHGKSRTPTFSSWNAMWSRCTRPGTNYYHRYGGRGITVCDRWRDFEAFLADMGERPTGTSIDRLDNDGPYEPANCRWATASQQATQRRSTRWITLDGATRSLTAWARLRGLNYITVHARIRHGWSPEDALSLPPGARRA